MRSTTSDKIIERLERIFMIHVLPPSVTSDNGPQFVSSMFERYLEECGIKHSKTMPLWPQTNGEMERKNWSLLKRLGSAQAAGKQWKEDIRKYLIAYRSTPNTTTRVSPAELLFGRKSRTNLPEFYEDRLLSGGGLNKRRGRFFDFLPLKSGGGGLTETGGA